MPTLQRLTVVPAYGRDYKSKKAALADWDAEKDFQIADIFSNQDGRYVNRQQVPNTLVNIRYAKLTKVAVVLTEA